MPDTYTSQFSGEEIDAALRAAQIISGAETPAALREKLEIYGSNTALSPTDPTTVETALKYRSNPNLLDNWYFGNPVNQRNGYIVPAGVEYYKVDGFVPQGPIPETVRVDYIDDAGSARFNYGGVPCYVPKGGGYVRGYTGSGYTVDRWKALSLQGTVTCEKDCLAIENTDGTVASIIIDQIFEPDLSNALKGKTLTLSVMAKSVTGKFSFQSGNKTLDITEPGLSYLVLPDWVDKYNYGMRFFNSGGAGKIEISAAKLELGDTQTLAHKEGDKWVLNEIPDFGEQLRRCQRYYIDTLHIAVNESDKIMNEVWATGSTTGSGVHYSKGTQFPVIMRTIPVVTLYSVLSKTANKVSCGSSGGDISATPTARFVGTTGFAQILMNGVDDALNGNQIQFHYIASADL
jgi:hypothetical protein|nr:MAG TPA: hypothetical protein [Caudoviricetes sp.]